MPDGPQLARLLNVMPFGLSKIGREATIARRSGKETPTIVAFKTTK